MQDKLFVENNKIIQNVYICTIKQTNNENYEHTKSVTFGTW